MSSFAFRSLATAASLALATCAFAQPPYRVVDHWKIGGVGGWDYLLADPAAHLLYLTHGRGWRSWIRRPASPPEPLPG